VLLLWSWVPRFLLQLLWFSLDFVIFFF
jgi:hypothetical protein